MTENAFWWNVLLLTCATVLALAWDSGAPFLLLLFLEV